MMAYYLLYIGATRLFSWEWLLFK